MEIRCFIYKLEAVRELPLTSDIEHRDAPSANHRAASKAEMYLLNYSAVIKAAKSLRCAEADITIDYSTENMKGKTVSFLSFHFRALHIRLPSQGACPIALTPQLFALSLASLQLISGRAFQLPKAYSGTPLPLVNYLAIKPVVLKVPWTQYNSLQRFTLT